jgi:hypothetical protein
MSRESPKQLAEEAAMRSPVSRRQGAVPSAATVIMAGLTLLITLAAAAAGVAASGTLQGAVPQPVPASAPATEFSSARALEHVRVVATEPHPMGSPANAVVRDYLVGELRGLGVTPQVQRATAAYYPVPGLLQAGTVENVLARLPGTGPGGKAFLLAAHYDSVPTGPGATDNGSGVASALETLRALKAGPPLRNDVVFLFSDGEERGLLGARAFVEQHPWADDVGVVLNLDTRGNTGPALMLATNDEGGWVVDEFAKATPYPMTTSDSVAFFRRSGGNSDLSVFLDAGWAGLQVSSTGGISHYHSALDNVAELDERSLQHLGSCALALTRQFGSVSLEQTKAPDSVYFNLSRFLVHYPQAWSIPFAVFALLLGVGVVVLGLRQGHVRPGGVGLGFVVLPVAMAAAALVAELTWTVILALHPGGVWALEYRPAIIWIGVASLTVAVTATLYAALRNRIRVFELSVGGLLWWLLLAAAASVVFPPVSYLFTWPLVFSLIGLGILFAGEGRPNPGWRRFTVLMITGIPAAFLVASGVYGITMTRELLLPYVAPLFAAAIVLMLGLLIPNLDLIAQAGRWVLAGTSAALALGLLLVGSLTAGFDARHPQPDTILYALNLDTGQAIWASADEKPDAWTAQFLGADPRRGSVADYLGGSDAKLHSAAPPATLLAPNVRFLDAHGADGAQTVRMRVTGPAGANLIVLEAGSEVRGVTVDGRPVADRPLSNSSRVSPWTLNFWNPPAGGFDLTLEVQGTAPLRVTARASTPGLPPIAGTAYRDRPPDTMPISADPASIEQDSSTVVSKSFSFVTP